MQGNQRDVPLLKESALTNKNDERKIYTVSEFKKNVTV